VSIYEMRAEHNTKRAVCVYECVAKVGKKGNVGTGQSPYTLYFYTPVFSRIIMCAHGFSI